MTAKQHYAKITCGCERGNVYEVITESECAESVHLSNIFIFLLLGTMHKLEQKVECCTSNGSTTPITIEQIPTNTSPSSSPSQY